MIRTAVKGYFYVDYVVAGKNTGLHRTLNTCINRRDIFFGNFSANNFVDEFVALAGFVRLDRYLNVTVLTLTAGLTCILAVFISCGCDGFLI